MKLAPLFCLGVLLLAAVTVPARAGSPLLVVDRSGSMIGFDDTRAVPETVRMLRDQIPGSPQVLWALSNSGQPTRLISSPDPPTTEGYGGETRLFESVQLALKQQPSASSLWLLTDNVPSNQQPDQDLDRLYYWLRNSNPPYQLTLFVLKLPFKGTLYRADGTSHLTDAYTGTRAVVLYAALLDLRAEKEFHAALDRVGALLDRQRPRALLRLRCKPLQLDSVTMDIEGGSMRLAPDGSLEGRGREGETFTGTFKIRLRSNMEHVQFRNVRPMFETSEFFRTADFDTREVRPTLSERNIEEIGRGWSGLEATLSLQPVRLNRTFSSSLKALAKGKDPGIIEGYLTLGLEVDRKNFVILPEDVRAFSTAANIFEDPSPEVQSRVYRLQELFQEKFVESHMRIQPGREPAPGDSRSEPGKVPVRILMSYSAVPAFMVVGEVVLPLALLLAAALALWRTWGTRYQIVGAGFDERPFRVRVSHPVRGSSGLLGALYQVPPFVWFSAAPGWNVDGGRRRRLSREGGALELSPRSGGPRVRFQVIRARKSGGATPWQRSTPGAAPARRKF
jgi:hypothetical protein